MIHGIRDAFTEILVESPWMDEKTREAARQKVQYGVPVVSPGLTSFWHHNEFGQIHISMFNTNKFFYHFLWFHNSF